MLVLQFFASVLLCVLHNQGNCGDRDQSRRRDVGKMGKAKEKRLHRLDTGLVFLFIILCAAPFRAFSVQYNDFFGPTPCPPTRKEYMNI